MRPVCARPVVLVTIQRAIFITLITGHLERYFLPKTCGGRKIYRMSHGNVFYKNARIWAANHASGEKFVVKERELIPEFVPPAVQFPWRDRAVSHRCHYRPYPRKIRPFAGQVLVASRRTWGAGLLETVNGYGRGGMGIYPIWCRMSPCVCR